MRHLLIIFACFIFFLAEEVSAGKNSKATLSQEALKVDFPTEEEYGDLNTVLQFLYKVDGNLPELSPSKIKRLTYVYAQIGNRKLDEMTRKKFWDEEISSDSDYYIWRIKTTHKEAINELEALRSLYPRTVVIKKLKGFYASLNGLKTLNPYEDDPFLFIQNLIEADRRFKVALEAQEEALANLDRLGAASRLKKTGITNNEEYFFQKTVFSSLLMGLTTNYLQNMSALLRKPAPKN